MTDTAGMTESPREYSDVEYVFGPHDHSLPDLRHYVRDVWDRRAFMVANARAELKGPYAGTVLGEAWQVLDPLFQAMISFPAPRYMPTCICTHFSDSGFQMPA